MKSFSPRETEVFDESLQDMFAWFHIHVYRIAAPPHHSLACRSLKTAPWALCYHDNAEGKEKSQEKSLPAPASEKPLFNTLH